MRNGEIYYLIGKILALDAPSGEETGCPAVAKSAVNTEQLAEILHNDGIDWRKFVQIASNNYVLQSLYPKLIENELAGPLPPGLIAHLEHIHRLNNDRNRDILLHCSNINTILVSRGIIPVFMKGAGNLLDGLYCSQGERIMADIDILATPEEMEPTAQLLIKEGYRPHGSYDPAKVKTMKHYPLLRHEGLHANVEIHRMPLNIQFAAHFDHRAVFREMRPAPDYPQMMVMSDPHKIILSFFHSQLVHWGHYHACPSLRELYDLFLLSCRRDPAEVYSSIPRFRGKALGYLKVMQKVLGITQKLPKETKAKGKIYLLRHNLAMSDPRAGRVLYTILKSWRLYISIPLSSLFSKNLRMYILVRLRDRDWYERNLLPVKYFRRKARRID